MGFESKIRCTYYVQGRIARIQLKYFIGDFSNKKRSSIDGCSALALMQEISVVMTCKQSQVIDYVAVILPISYQPFSYLDT